ncbi:MAG TPA: hypothetical protein PLV92_17130, partial [Pirellulaceae bacterium]|nr:hypothetical protein [Pirellulaceae bacterium]
FAVKTSSIRRSFGARRLGSQHGPESTQHRKLLAYSADFAHFRSPSSATMRGAATVDKTD